MFLIKHLKTRLWLEEHFFPIIVLPFWPFSCQFFNPVKGGGGGDDNIYSAIIQSQRIEQELDR